MAAKAKSWIPHPNPGRMTRSPFEVPRMMREVTRTRETARQVLHQVIRP